LKKKLAEQGSAVYHKNLIIVVPFYFNTLDNNKTKHSNAKGGKTNCAAKTANEYKASPDKSGCVLQL
jgi:hypothetical protein